MNECVGSTFNCQPFDEDVCLECAGTGTTPCESCFWCTDRGHDGTCHACDGTGDPHVACLYCHRPCPVGPTGANCHYCDVSGTLRDGRWRVVICADRVPFTWIDPDGARIAWKASVTAKTQLESAWELKELPYERTLSDDELH